MLKYFSYAHLPEDSPQRLMSMSFAIQADLICKNLSPSPERTVALRKLLESKDAAVRAAIYDA